MNWLFGPNRKSVGLAGTMSSRHTALLACGGPSLASIDKEAVRASGLTVMALNNTPKSFPCDLWLSRDAPSQFAQEIWEAPNLIKFTRIRFHQCTYAYPQTYYFRENQPWLTEQIFAPNDIVWDNTSGHGPRTSMMNASRILYLLGFRRIGLLGCDWQQTHGATNYAYPKRQRRRHVNYNNQLYHFMGQRFEMMRPLFEQAGLEIINATPDSKLEAFPIREWQTLRHPRGDSDAPVCIVAGPESAGNRLMAACLVQAGCHGSGSTDQPDPDALPVDRPCVLIRHDANDVRDAMLDLNGRRVFIIIVTRDWHANARSMVSRGHVPDLNAAKERLRSQLPQMMRMVESHRLPYVMTSYEALVADRDHVTSWVCSEAGIERQVATDSIRINTIESPEIYDANEKWKRGAPLVIDGMYGMGDCIYQRPFIRDRLKMHSEVYLRTPWPELYWDLESVGNLRFVKPDTQLRTQAQNANRTNQWRVPPLDIDSTKIKYGPWRLKQYGSIIRAMESILPLTSKPIFDCPPTPAATNYIDTLVRTNRPVAIVRFPTIRKEWRADARNCLPQYMQTVVDELRSTHHIVSVAHNADGHEWFVEEPQHVDQAFHLGELNVESLVALMHRASIAVGPVGWMLPMGLFCRTPTFMVFGGWGGIGRPDTLTDPRMDLSRFHACLPDNFCLCKRMKHDCDKTIDGKRFMDELHSFLERTPANVS